MKCLVAAVPDPGWSGVWGLGLHGVGWFRKKYRRPCARRYSFMLGEDSSPVPGYVREPAYTSSLSSRSAYSCFMTVSTFV